LLRGKHFDTKPLNFNIFMGDGKGMKVSKTGKLRVKFSSYLMAAGA
jgi:hypothetical protein